MPANYTAQEAFDLVYQKLSEQGQACEDDGGTCYYRHQGMACAYGHLILDEDYKPEMEGQWVADLVREFGPVVTIDGDSHHKLLWNLQDAHDMFMCSNASDGNSRWEAAMEDIAKKFNLKFEE